jgi:hypothetical protein
MPVALESGYAEEKGPGTGFSTVIGKVGHFDVGIPDDFGSLQARDDFVQPHGHDCRCLLGGNAEVWQDE